MFRSLNDDDGGGFVNEGLEVSESCDDKQSNNALSVTLKDATEIQITRSSYDLKKLHEEMNYKQPQSKSSELSSMFNNVYHRNKETMISCLEVKILCEQ